MEIDNSIKTGNDNNLDQPGNDDLENIYDIEFSSELSTSYLDYAVAVILKRAIPSIYDGLKDVQRRILWFMYLSGCTHLNRFVKCAFIVGNVSGKYHPHGEKSLYDALVRLAQKFSFNVPLIESQGNFGSIDGDSPAAQRYTEARLSHAADLLIDRLDHSLLSMRKNYDASLLEPIYLPCTYPNILINGNSGIAVGCTSQIPSHNPREIINIAIYMLKKPGNEYQNVKYSEIRHLISGPDFPNYCLIDSFNLETLYETGQATVTTSSEISYDDKKHEIVIKGLPYNVMKLKLIKSIVECSNEKIIHGIVDIIDDSEGVDYKIRVILSQDVNGKVIARRITKYTLCSNSIGFVFRFIVNNKPQVIPLTDIFKHFIDNRIEIIKSKLRLENTNKIMSIERDLAVFIATKTKSTIDIIDRILNSEDIVSARLKLLEMTFDISELSDILPDSIKKLGETNCFKLTHLQIEWLLNTPIVKLNKQKTTDLEGKIRKNTEHIINNEKILSDDEKVKAIIISELESIIKHIDKTRVCSIVLMDKNMRLEDMEPEKDVLLLLKTDQTGYQEIKYYETSFMKAQKRGGKGRIMFEAEGTNSTLMATTHDEMLIFSAYGYGYKINIFDIYYRGKTLMEIISLREGDHIVSIKKFSYGDYDNVIILTNKGLIKKHSTRDFNVFNRLGKRICVVEEDYIQKVVFTKNNEYCVLFSEHGKFICLDNTELREFVSRKTKGIKGMKLKGDDRLKEVFGINKQDIEHSVLLIDAAGNAKRLSVSMLSEKVSHRNTIGVSCINKKYGFLAACVLIKSFRCKIIVVTKSGKIMIINFDEIPETKRLNKGLKLVSLDKNDYIVFADVI